MRNSADARAVPPTLRYGRDAMNPPQGPSPSHAAESAEERTDPPPGSVVVGVDGSPDSDRAVDWAFTQAARRGRGLHLTCAVTMLVDDPGGPEAKEGLNARGKEVLAAAAARGIRAFQRRDQLPSRGGPCVGVSGAGERCREPRGCGGALEGTADSPVWSPARSASTWPGMQGARSSWSERRPTAEATVWWWVSTIPNPPSPP